MLWNLKLKQTSLTNKPTTNITLNGKTWQVFSLILGTRKDSFYHSALLTTFTQQNKSIEK